MNVTAIVPAAGIGRRMEHHSKKPYLLLQGKPLLAWVLAVLDAVPAVTQIVIPVHPGDEQHCQQEVVEPAGLHTPVAIVTGGAQRQDSVRNGLAAVTAECDMVLVHDAARPLVTRTLIEASLAAAQVYHATTVAVPVKDTIAIIDREQHVIEQFPDRARLYSVQTPQTFTRDLLQQAHRKACAEGYSGTDDASLVAWLGVPVAIVPGMYTNIKITTPEDLLIAEALLQQGAL